jgi:hypothetical protein
MVAAIRAIAENIAAELGKTALDERVLKAMAKVPRHEFVPVEVQQVIPVGLLSAQQLVVVEKDLNGRVTTKEIMPVLFSVSRNPTNLQSGHPEQDDRQRREVVRLPKEQGLPVGGIDRD